MDFSTFARPAKKAAVQAMPTTFSQQRMQFFEHAAYWVFMYLFVFDYHFLQDNWVEAIASTFLEVLTYAAIVYLNLLVLVPFLLEKKRPFAYVGSLVVVVVAYIFLMRWTGLENQFYEIGGWRNVFSMVLNTGLFLLISSLYWFFKKGQHRDDLLKSNEFDRLFKAISQAAEWLEKGQTPAQSTPAVPLSPPPSDDFFFVKSDQKIVKVAFGEILFIEALQKYARIHTASGRIVTLMSISQLEEMLPGGRFARVHRSYIVSLEKVDSLEGNLLQIGAHQIPLSKGQREAFLEWVQKKGMG